MRTPLQQLAPFLEQSWSESALAFCRWVFFAGIINFILANLGLQPDLELSILSFLLVFFSIDFEFNRGESTGDRLRLAEFFASFFPDDPLFSLADFFIETRVSQKNQKSEFWNVPYPSGFHRLDEPPEKNSVL